MVNINCLVNNHPFEFVKNIETNKGTYKAEKCPLCYTAKITPIKQKQGKENISCSLGLHTYRFVKVVEIYEGYYYNLDECVLCNKARIRLQTSGLLIH